jgi:hypothetical protein
VNFSFYRCVHWEVQTGRNPAGFGFPAARSNHYGELERADLVAGYNGGADVWEVKAWNKRHSKKKGDDVWSQPYSYSADLDERAIDQGVDLYDAFPGYKLQNWAVEYKLGTKDYIAWGDPNPDNPGVVFYDDANKVKNAKGSGAGSDDVRPSYDYLEEWDGLLDYGTIQKKSGSGGVGVVIVPGPVPIPIPVPVPFRIPVPIFDDVV